MPLTTLWSPLFDICSDEAAFEAKVKTLVRPVIITEAENAALTAAGLAHTMPLGWDGRDVAARYKAVGIVFEASDLARLTS